MSPHVCVPLFTPRTKVTYSQKCLNINKNRSFSDGLRDEEKFVFFLPPRVGDVQTLQNTNHLEAYSTYEIRNSFSEMQTVNETANFINTSTINAQYHNRLLYRVL